jgi:hypothetical protein
MPREIDLFAEDHAHESVIKPLLQKIASEFGIEVSIRALSARGGFGRVESQVRQYVAELLAKTQALPDLVVIATDANCEGVKQRRKRFKAVIEPIDDRCLLAVHIERWLLLDPAAFKQVLGEGCTPPDKKCNRDRYKELLIEAVLNAGQVPLLHGLEHAADIVSALDFARLNKKSELWTFANEVRSFCRAWQTAD